MFGNETLFRSGIMLLTTLQNYCICIIGYLMHFSNVHCMLLKPKPIVIVPGIGGSQIEAKLDRNQTSHYWCYHKSAGWFTIWLNVEELMPMAKECWIDNIKLVYNPDTNAMENAPGVTTRVPDFGNTTAVEWLDPSVYGFGMYFYPLVQALVNSGYMRGHDLRAAPYDFRYHPGSAGEYFAKLKTLIEDSYYKRGKILLVSHSMGAPYTLYFLNHQTQQWKDKYIDAWVTISGAYAGSVNILLAYISGYGFGIPSIIDKPRTLRQPERTYSSLPFLLPDSRFWDEKEVLVETVNRTYGVHDWDALFNDLQFPLAMKILRSTPKAWHDEPPNVKTYCFYGSEVKTASKLNYRKGYFPDYYPDIEYESGDGTVPLRSLRACERWKKRSSKKVVTKTFLNAEHNGILKDPELIRSLLELLGVIR